MSDLIETKVTKALLPIPHTLTLCVKRLRTWLTSWNQGGQVECKDGLSVQEIESPYSKMAQLVNHGV